MRSETINAMDVAKRIGWTLALVLSIAPPLAGQTQNMNFFVAVEGATWGANRGALMVSDSQCTDLAYPAGYGHLNWRAYLTGTAADDEQDQIARTRIGSGPWYNFYGVEIATDLAQLHSDDNNLWLESAVTVKGEALAEEALEIPYGSQLDGGDFSREGPFFCFGVP